MKTKQMIVWLAIPMVLNGMPCQVVAADVIAVGEGSALLSLADGTLEVSMAHVYNPQDGSVDAAIGLVNEAGFIDLRVPPAE